MTTPVREVPSRRRFLKATAAYAAGSFVGPGLAAAATGNTSKVSANERVNVAFVGVGNRGENNLQSTIATGMCNVVALCDVDFESPHTLPALAANQEADPATRSNKLKGVKLSPKAPRFTDFRQMFDKVGDQIDAVVITTPDHTHFPAAMLAMSLGKHVYVEKPLAHTFGQVERMMDLAARTGVVTQMGNQGHSSENRTQFESWTKSGVIKDVTRIVAHMNNGRRWHGWGETVKAYPSEPLPSGMDWDSWTGPAPMNTFSERLHPGNWRSWFDYGCGAMGDWAPHLLDTCHRFLDLGLPETVTAEKLGGRNPLVYPQATTLRFGFPERCGMPACDVFWYDGVANRPDLGPGITPDEQRRPGKAIYSKTRTFHGGSHSAVLRLVTDDASEAQQLPGYETVTTDHYTNFLLACRGLAAANSPFSVGGPLTQVLNLGMIGQRLGGTLAFDRASKRFTDSEDANALLDPAPRSGWEEFYRM